MDAKVGFSSICANSRPDNKIQNRPQIVFHIPALLENKAADKCNSLCLPPPFYRHRKSSVTTSSRSQGGYYIQEFIVRSLHIFFDPMNVISNETASIVCPCSLGDKDYGGGNLVTEILPICCWDDLVCGDSFSIHVLGADPAYSIQALSPSRTCLRSIKH